ncbi:MAG TPA: TonB-dependent receptor, partial [Terricaulis sp.]|nr:TonB-dependent receptor [Terricaulis sp.]
LSGLGFGGGVRYVGESFGNTVNDLVIPDYTLFDFFARYDLTNIGADGVIFSVNARNLADETYVATCNTVQSCYYGSGRTVTARLQYRW